MRKVLLIAASLLLMGMQIAQAQKTVQGTVLSSDDNLGLPGATIKVKGTGTGTVTNIDGEFKITVPSGSNILEISYTGMKPKTVNVSSTSTVLVTMEPDALSIDGVVVTGYGVSKKAAFTGSAGQVGEDVVTKQVESNVINSLQGSVAGLQISSATGQPGAPTVARIRGSSSVSTSNAPLYVVDGVPISTGNYGMYSYTDPLASINPEDIENISVLKDASATSIYGSRASNGVIVITTKKGTEGKSSLTFSAKAGISTPPTIKRNFTKVSLEDYQTIQREGYMNNDPFATEEDYIRKMRANGVDFTKGVNTDWWDEITRNGIIQEYGLTSSGATDKTNYFISGGYFQNQGFVVGTDFTRYTARVNVDHKPTKYLTIGSNLSAAYAEVNSVPTELAFASPIWGASMMRPTDPVKNPDGTWYDGGTAAYNGRYNPVALRQDEYRDIAFQQQYKVLFSPYVQVKFLKNLFFQSKAGVDFITVKEKNYWSQTVNPQGKSMGGLTQIQDETSVVTNFTNTLNWLPSIGENNFNFLVGQEAQNFKDFSSYASGFMFSTPLFNEVGTAAERDGFSDNTSASISSYFLSAEYDYNSKYYLSGSIRYDGSSRFSPETRWGTFYSFGAKYRISQEAFMASTQDWLNNLTFRLSYGTTGNQNVNYYQYQGLYGSSDYAGLNGLFPGSINNDVLSWETRNKFNVGIEFSVFNRFTVELDYYNDKTNGMHLNRPQSRTTGFTGILSNIGRMQNQGVEAQINALILNNKNLKWTFAVNFTSNHNKILELVDNKDIITGIGILREGLCMGTFYVQEWAGVDPANGKPLWYKEDGTTTSKYTDAKPRIVGNSQSKFYGGFSTRLDFFNFDLNIQFNYNYGNKIFVNDLRYIEHVGDAYTQPTTYYVFDNRWTTPGQVTDVPKYIDGGNNGANNWSSRYLVDGSYLRLKSVMLGYTVPKKVVTKLHLSSIRAFIACDNLLTFTHKSFRGYDPESGLGGTQAANYPIPVNYTLGLNIGF